MTSNGQRGADFERRVRDHLIRAGYVVIRSAASKTGVDLVALGGPVVPVLLVQAKTDGRLDPGEWNALHALATYSGVVPVLARQERVGRRNVVALYRLDGPKVPRARNAPLVPLLLDVMEGVS